VQDPETGNDVDLQTKADVYDLFNSWAGNGDLWQERRYTYAQLCGIGGYMIDKSFQDVLRRKYYCEKFNVPPFVGAFDDQPEWWVKGMSLVDTAESEANKYLRRKNG